MEDLSILIVEDDPVTRALLQKRLSKTRCELSLAKNGVEAVDRISKTCFDVVLTDLMMPGGIDGMGVLDFAMARCPRMEVILITAHGSIENAVGAMKKGAFDYLTKPINFDELFIRLEKISTIRSMARAALDLREALDATERNAAQTIQDLELTVSDLQRKFAEIKELLSKTGIYNRERIDRIFDTIFPSNR